MSNPVARRYAQALYEEAEQQERLDAVDEDMELIRESFDGAPELVRFFKSPVIPRQKKKVVVEELFKERLQPLTYRFMQLLIDKEREALFETVMRTYRTLRDEQSGIVEVQARAAHALSETERQKLVQTVEEMTGQEVRLQVRQDKSLIGGLVLRVGDTVYDGSVRHQLESLRERMQRGRVVTNGQNA